MNRRVSAGHLVLIMFLLLPALKNLEAFIQIQSTSTKAITAVYSTELHSRSSELLQSLERITCLPLEVRDGYLSVKEPEKLPLLYASITGQYPVEMAMHSDRRCSPTGKELLLGAIRSSSVYKVRQNRDAAFGRVASGNSIELDFSDFNKIIYRDVPREAFDIGMIFLHELAHRHLKLKDPRREEIVSNSFVKGETVKFINRIERELGLPERRHYAPVKIRYIRSEPHWGVYFGTGADRIELDARLGLR